MLYSILLRCLKCQIVFGRGPLQTILKLSSRLLFCFLQSAESSQRPSPVIVLRLHGNIDGVVAQEILNLAFGDLKLVNYFVFSIYISVFFWSGGRESAVFGVLYTRIGASLPN